MRLKKFLYKHSMGFSPLRFSFVINIINVCDRRCSFCPYHSPKLADNYHTRWMKDQPGLLPYKDFERFIKGLGVFKKMITNIAITGKGEPFLHKELYKYCGLLEKYKIPFSITTNGLDHVGIGLMLDKYKYLTKVRVSLYDKKAVESYSHFMKHEKLGYYNMTGKPIGMTEADDGFISAQYGIEHKRALPKDFNKGDYCSASFSFLTINTDGSIVPCYSFDETSTIEDSFWKIWNGKLIRKYRRSAVNGRNMKYADCLNCGVLYERAEIQSNE